MVDTPQMYTQWSSNADPSVAYIKTEEPISEPQNIQRDCHKENEVNIKDELVNNEENMAALSLTREKPQFNLLMPSQGPAMEVYSPVIPVHPGELLIIIILQGDNRMVISLASDRMSSVLHES